jgi:hypothetical protein
MRRFFFSNGSGQMSKCIYNIYYYKQQDKSMMVNIKPILYKTTMYAYVLTWDRHKLQAGLHI